VTVQQASRLFDDAGVPRSERSIQRYCKRGHLDCYLFDREQDVIYLIDPESLERRVEELKQLSEISMSQGVATGRVTARHGASERDVSRQGNEGEEGLEDVEQLQKKILVLTDKLSLKDVENRVKDKLLLTLNEQRREDMNKIAELGQNIGEWKTKYLALSAPAPDSKETGTPKQQFREAEVITTTDDTSRHVLEGGGVESNIKDSKQEDG